MKYYIAIIISITLFNSCKKEDPFTDSLYKTYNGIIGTNDNSTIITYDNNLVICGYSYDGNIHILKISKSGNLIWRKDIFEGIESEASSVVESGNHDLFICGYKRGVGVNTGSDVLLIKVDTNGDIIWSKTYDRLPYEYGFQIIRTNDNNLLICGRCFTNLHGYGSDINLIKVNYDGDTIWTKTYSDTLFQWPYHILQTQNNDYLITGQNFDYNGYKELYLLRVDQNGNKLWDKKIGPATGKIGFSAIELENGDFIICGSNASNHYRQVMFSKIDKLGNEYWEKEISLNIFRGEGYAIKKDIDGTYTVVGAVTDDNDQRADNLLLKVDENCNIIWYKIFGSTGSDWGANLLKDANDINIITGELNVGSASQIYMTKIENDGEYIY